MHPELKKLAEEYPPKKKTSNVRIKYPDVFLILKEHTSFLKESSSTSQRLWHVRNDTTTIPSCNNPECNEKTNWIPKYSDYGQYCSKKCHNKHKTLKAVETEKNKQQELYGEDYESLSRQDKIRITNLRKYGVDNPFKDVEKIREANRKKYGKDYHFQQHLEEDVLDKLNDKEWLYNQNKTLNKSCTEIATELGVNNTTVNKRLYSFGITPSHTYSSSHHEKRLAQLISNLGIRVIENERAIINPYELDIILPDQKIAIEYCGLYWHNELHKDKNYHFTKYELCKERGIQLLTLYEDEFREKEKIVISAISHKLGKNMSQRIYARNCTVSEISPYDKSKFLSQNHIQGNGNSSLNVALKDMNNNIVACGSFLKSDENSMILNRFSTSCIVPGALSKIMSYVKKTTQLKEIITFADLRWSDGSLYEKVGFVKDKALKPDYYYIYNNSRYHKFNFRHDRLKKILSSYDPSLSEHENCFNNKIYRIYDCGKIRYTYTL